MWYHLLVFTFCINVFYRLWISFFPLLTGRRDLKSIEYYIDASIITSGLVRAFSTGNWSHPTLSTVKCTGVVASVKQINPLQVVSEMRKMRLRVQYAAKLGDARYP
jgi:DNA-directed RNA polymerase-4/5 subunit 2